jgi:hypothetical protein
LEGPQRQWLITFHYRETDNAGPLKWHAMPLDGAVTKVEALSSEVRKFKERFDAVKKQF